MRGGRAERQKEASSLHLPAFRFCGRINGLHVFATGTCKEMSGIQFWISEMCIGVIGERRADTALRFGRPGLHVSAAKKCRPGIVLHGPVRFRCSPGIPPQFPQTKECRAGRKMCGGGVVDV